MEDRPQPRRIALIGAPSDLGASRRGSSLGPEALRVAGIASALRRLGHEVVDRGNLAGPVNPDMAPPPGTDRMAEVTRWCALVRDGCAAALAEGRVPIVLGGDHSLAAGSAAAAARHARETGRELWVLWLDAHADFNTPESSPTGNVHGMPAAAIAGIGDPGLSALAGEVPMAAAGRIVQLGVRSVDEIERRAVLDAGLAIHDMREIDERGMRDVVAGILGEIAARGDVHLHLSFDVDFLDPGVAPGVGTPVAGGPTYREAQLVMEMVHDAGLLGSLDVVELNPALDERNRTAEVAVELIASLFGQQILARPRR